MTTSCCVSALIVYPYLPSFLFVCDAGLSYHVVLCFCPHRLPLFAVLLALVLYRPVFKGTQELDAAQPPMPSPQVTVMLFAFNIIVFKILLYGVGLRFFFVVLA